MAILGLLVVVLAVAACGDDTTPTSTPPPPDTDRLDGLVLRVMDHGGFVAPGADFTAIPSVSIYADGRVIVVGPTTMEYPGRALPNLLVGHSSQAQVRTAVADARAAGVRDPAPDLNLPRGVGVSDAGTTTFTLRTGGRTTTVDAYTLGAVEPESPARRRLAELRDRLVGLGSGADEQYRPEAMSVRVQLYDEAAFDGVTPSDVDWPLGPMPPLEQRNGRCVPVTGADLERLWPVAQQARSNTRWHSAGFAYQLIFRPELPGDEPCTPRS